MDGLFDNRWLVRSRFGAEWHTESGRTLGCDKMVFVSMVRLT